MQFDQIMQVLFTSPAAVAGIIAYFLDITLARRHPLTRKDSGRHWWAKFKYYGRDPRSEEFYSLPYGLSKYFPSVWHTDIKKFVEILERRKERKYDIWLI